jgi:hypothetical protein
MKTKQKLMVAPLVSYRPLVNFVWSLPFSQEAASEPDTEPDESNASNALYVFPICAGVVLYRNIPSVTVSRPKFCKDYEI